MIKLERYAKNPIIKPRENIWWEAKAVFNPAVIHDHSRVHLIYRAMGADRISRFGHAYSTDGYNFKGFNEYPVFESEPSNLYERLGSEDPRVVCFDDIYYLTYTSASVHPASYPTEKFATATAPWRIRVSMLSTTDFVTFHRHGVIVPSADSKDAVLFPEKIDGQYVMLHRIWPDIWIAYSKDLINWYDHRLIIKPRRGSWDNLNIGSGAPPIKTKFGWLLFYHGVDHDKIYRAGIIVLDLKNPNKVIYRSTHPVLEPSEKYEKEGMVSNVVFPTGVINKDDRIFVYYGSADSTISLATIKEKELFDYLEKNI